MGVYDQETIDRHNAMVQAQIDQLETMRGYVDKIKRGVDVSDIPYIPVPDWVQAQQTYDYFMAELARTIITLWESGYRLHKEGGAE